MKGLKEPNHNSAFERTNNTVTSMKDTMHVRSKIFTLIQNLLESVRKFIARKESAAKKNRCNSP